MTSKYPVLGNRPIDQWKVTELKEELKRRKLPTKGLKDDLIKRLHESIKAECASEVEEASEPFNSQPDETLPEKETAASFDESEKKITKECDAEIETLNTDPTDQSKSVASENCTIFDIEQPNQVNETISEGAFESIPELLSKETQQRLVTCDLNTVELDESIENASPFVPLSEEGNVDEDQNRNGSVTEYEESKEEMMIVEPNSVPEEDETKHSPAANQVSEVNQTLGLCDSVSADSVSIIEKNELKSNDTVELEIDVVKPEKNESVDCGDSEKLNLDRSSGDESEEDIAVDYKQVNENVDTRVANDTDALTNTNIIADEGIMLSVLEKRKLHVNNSDASIEPPKKQPRWNSDANVRANTHSSPPNESPTRVLLRFDSSLSEETTKERIVPPSEKPPTTSLKIDRFLRPFTLKAVQELLGKTGAVEKFWMDSIKTHCFVSYSSVDEATATRDALYNLQWPPNGGRNLTVEFVDPEEVLTRLENPGKPAESASGTLQTGQRQRTSSPPLPPAKEKDDSPIVTLDDLFRKTIATPRIYYLPLSEEQVKCKRPVNSDAVKI